MSMDIEKWVEARFREVGTMSESDSQGSGSISFNGYSIDYNVSYVDGYWEVDDVTLDIDEDIDKETKEFIEKNENDISWESAEYRHDCFIS